MTQITVTSPNAEAVAEHLRRMYPDYIKPEQMAVIQAVAIDTTVEMQEPGEKPSGPIKWDSEKQRRAFFATNGFGGGIPTKRTNAYIEAWKYSISDMAARIFNDSPEERYVGGNAWGRVFSGIHVGRWKNWGAARLAMRARLPGLQRQALANAVQAFLSEKG